MRKSGKLDNIQLVNKEEIEQIENNSSETSIKPPKKKNQKMEQHSEKVQKKDGKIRNKSNKKKNKKAKQTDITEQMENYHSQETEDKTTKAIKKSREKEEKKKISKPYDAEENENQLEKINLNQEIMKEINDSPQMVEVNKEMRVMEIEELKHQLKEPDIIQPRSNSLNPISSLNETQILSSDFESICEMKERENVSQEINENENKIMTLLDFDSNELYQLFFTISETGDLQINTNLPIDINNMTGNSVTKSVWEIMINNPITEEELNNITNEILKEKVRKLFMNRGDK